LFFFSSRPILRAGDRAVILTFLSLTSPILSPLLVLLHSLIHLSYFWVTACESIFFPPVVMMTDPLIALHSTLLRLSLRSFFLRL